MTKLYKAEIYILDLNDSFSNLEEIINTIENKVDISINHFNDKDVSFEWDDDLDINYSNCTVETYRKYFI